MSEFVWKKGDMRGQRLKLLLIFMITLLFLWTLLITFISSESHVERYRPPAYKKSEINAHPVSSDNTGEEKVENQQKTDLNTADLDQDRMERTDTAAVVARGEKKAENQQKTDFNNADLDKDRTERTDNTEVDARHVEPKISHPKKKIDKKAPPVPTDGCNGCKAVIDKVLQQYSQTWTKQELNYQNFRSQLKTKCNAIDQAIISKANTPLNSKLIYDGDKKTVRLVTPVIFKTFVKDSPFLNKTWDTCAVVGSGGILMNSDCGNAIDSAEFVIRCNLPPLDDQFKTHVGSRTNLVTANPSILRQTYESLSEHRRPFVESLRKYGNSMMLLPAFSFGISTPSAMRASYTIEDFGIPIRAIFFNPKYLQSLDDFWRAQGLKASRLSTGIMMACLALEICNNVHLYGFWPFRNHPYDFQLLNNHYYDNIPPKKGVHDMPVEFEFLLKLHNQGILRLHLGQCGKQ